MGRKRWPPELRSGVGKQHLIRRLSAFTLTAPEVAAWLMEVVTFKAPSLNRFFSQNHTRSNLRRGLKGQACVPPPPSEISLLVSYLAG